MTSSVHITLRTYRPPSGRAEDLSILVSPEIARAVETFATVDVYPAAEFLRTGQVSLTLEDDALDLDRACHLVPPDQVAQGVATMVRQFLLRYPTFGTDQATSPVLLSERE